MINIGVGIVAPQVELIVAHAFGKGLNKLKSKAEIQHSGVAHQKITSLQAMRKSASHAVVAFGIITLYLWSRSKLRLNADAVCKKPKTCRHINSGVGIGLVK